MKSIRAELKKTKAGSAKLAELDFKGREALLLDIARAIEKSRAEIVRENTIDVSLFKSLDPLRQRLELGESKLLKSIEGIRAVARLSDSLGKVLEEWRRPNGLVIKKIAVPLGVVGVIYESRPGVTIDLVALALKTGNGIVLKGGKESYRTNTAIVRAVKKVLKARGLPEDAVYLIDPRDNWKKDLLNAEGLVDVLIPRGGRGLIDFVRKSARLPVIETGAGVCHIFADESCNLEKAANIIVNAKVQAPGVCNALDTLVVHSGIAPKLLPLVAGVLAAFDVEIYADAPAFRILKDKMPSKMLKPAKKTDFGKEFLSLKMSIKTVKNFQEGLDFVSSNTSGHTEAILTKDSKHAEEFLRVIDAAVVIENASTRFTDGGEFGMGAEVGISTQKLHARGPMGIGSLMSYKWVVRGSGQVRKP